MSRIYYQESYPHISLLRTPNSFTKGLTLGVNQNTEKESTASSSTTVQHSTHLEVLTPAITEVNSLVEHYNPETLTTVQQELIKIKMQENMTEYQNALVDLSTKV